MDPMKTLRAAAVLTGFLACLTLLSADAYAEFNFTATPRHGAREIRFDASDPGRMLTNEEVTLSVQTDQAVQYQILQTVYQPLTSQNGDVIPQENLITFSPSKPLGTLRNETETPVTMGSNQIYTSNSAGESDSFVLIFNVHVPEDQPGGTYTTRISFTAEPVGGGAGVSPQIENLNIRVEIRPKFRFSVQNAKGSRDLDFGEISKEHPAASSVLKFGMDSNIGTTFRIVQQLTEPLMSQEGVSLDESALTFVATGGGSGHLGRSGPAEISASPEIVYTSGPEGATDALQIQYQLVPDSSQKAGIYTGTISFKVESDSPLTPFEVFSVPVRVEVAPIFYLDVEVEQGSSSLSFGTVKSTQTAQERKVILTVHSNLGEPYQVSQVVSRKLTSQEGSVLSKEHFTYFGSDAQTGNLTAMSPTPIEEGQWPVFTSDSKGTPGSFTLNYSLTVPPEARAGSYGSDLKYSMTTL